MMESDVKKSIILDALDKLRDQKIAVTIGNGVWTGKIVEFDDYHIMLGDLEGISLLKIKDINAIDWAPNFEIMGQ